MKLDFLDYEPLESELNESWTDDYGITYSADGKKILKVDKSIDPYCSIREGTEIICNRAFQRSRVLKVDFPNSVRIIGVLAFDGCKYLNDIQLPESLVTIEARAFCNCINIRSLKLPDSLETIRNKAFEGCSAMASIEIPLNVKEIAGNPFIASGIFVKNNSPFFYSDTTALYDCDKKYLIDYFGMSLMNNYYVRDGVVNIGNFAFYNSYARNIILPNSVKVIDSFAFSDNPFLETISFGNNLETISDGAFDGCKSLSSLIFPKSMKKIGFGAFYECSSLRDIKFLSKESNIEGIKEIVKIKSLQNIYIPKGCSKNYSNIIEGPLSEIITEFDE